MQRFLFPVSLRWILFSLWMTGLHTACETSSQTSQSPPPEAPQLQRISEQADTLVAREVRAIPGRPQVQTGAERLLDTYLDSLAGKRIGIVANHTSMVGDQHLVDTLLASGVQVLKVFAPEHGFRGAADAGAHIADGRDEQTGLPIFSLYGKSRKPNSDHLKGLDVVIFDIQDIGTRFYTYISTMSLVMEACAEQGIPFWVLDRPNPNGNYVDGPMMQAQHQSFIGKHAVPIVHGMTVGEYAQMVNGEGWLAGNTTAELTVIPCEGYTHAMTWEETGLPWIAPSPNIPTEYAAYLYPALCWFEPTPVSIGRGTHVAFTLMGTPWFESAKIPPSTARQSISVQMIPHTFTPISIPGKSTSPKFQDTACKGFRFEGRTDGGSLFRMGLKLMQDFHQQAPNQSVFFKKRFERWTGYSGFRRQIEEGMSPEEIYESWQPEVETFKEMRKGYLLYEDY